VTEPNDDPGAGAPGTCPRPRPGSAGTALCIGLSAFRTGIAPDEEPPAGAWPDLGYAGEVTQDLAAALSDLGFDCTILTEQDLPTAQTLGERISAAVTSVDRPGAQVVHVLSHGEQANSGAYVVGGDGRRVDSTKVESWICSIEDFPDEPRRHTLFLVDTCYSGQAARLDWLRAATERTRAWVIAASEPDALAFDGRLTRAVAAVLRRIHSGELDFAPSTHVPFVHLVHHVRQEVVRLGGKSQYVTGTPVDGLFEPPLVRNPRSALPGSTRVALTDVDPLTGPFGDLASHLTRRTSSTAQRATATVTWPMPGAVSPAEPRRSSASPGAWPPHTRTV
jgi:hypothetical protein